MDAITTFFKNHAPNHKEEREVFMQQFENAMTEYADSQAKERAIGFAEWIQLMNWEKVHSGTKSAWVNAEEQNIYINGSFDYFLKLINEHGKTTEQLYTEYEILTKQK